MNWKQSLIRIIIVAILWNSESPIMMFLLGVYVGTLFHSIITPILDYPLFSIEFWPRREKEKPDA